MSTTRRPARARRAPAPAAGGFDRPFAARRERLGRLLTRAEAGPVAAIFASGHEARRNGDVDYEFRQPSTFYYLTGFEEPDAVAVLRPGHEQPYVLFVRPHDPAMAIWVGERAGVQGAVRDYGATAAYPIEELEQRLPELLSGMRTVCFSFGADDRVEKLVTTTVAQQRGGGQRGGIAIQRVADPFPYVSQMRVIKTAEEIAALRKAIAVTGKGIDAAMLATRPGMYEYEVQAVLEAEYRKRGAFRNGFPSIVASGANTCTLHYTTNNAPIGTDDLVLLDTGAEVDYYGADVSRTYPASGRFTSAQRDVYAIVLEAQRQAIALVRPGVRFIEVHQRALKVLVDGLRHLGVLRGATAKLTKDGAYQPYFMHGTSHWLGLDVHDVGAYRQDGESVVLRPGMVLTVEPGLYIAPDAKAPRQLRGIGVRIEDDILVTRTGHENLSAHIPSAIDDLEAIVGG